MKFDELEVVVLKEDDEINGLAKGEHGTVLLVYTYPKEAYEVEFSYDDGTQKAQVTLLPDQIDKYENQQTEANVKFNELDGVVLHFGARRWR